MSNELTTTNKLPAVIIKSDNALVMALQGKQIGNCSKLEIVAVLSPALEKARFDLGNKIDASAEAKKDNIIFLDSVLKDITLFCKFITLDEIPTILHNGSRAKYDEPGKVFVTVSNVVRWFMSYMTEQTRIDARRELERLKNPPPAPPTPEELEEIRVAMIDKAFTTYKSTRVYVDYGNSVYDAIEKYKPIPLTVERKKEIATKARLFLIAEANRPAKNVFEQKRNREFVEAVSNGYTQAKEQIRIQAKKFALLAFFDDLIEVDEDIMFHIKPYDNAEEL